MKEYKMNHPKRGVALIINNFKIIKHEPRQGAEVDEEKIEETFKTLGFNVITEREKSGEEIRKMLKEKAGEDYTDSDCFLCFIMSHGDQTGIRGMDDKPVTFKDIYQPFANNDTLNGKPKLFFIQSCREMNHSEGKKVKRKLNPWYIKLEYLPADTLVHYSVVSGYTTVGHPATGSWSIQHLAKSLLKHANTRHLLSILYHIHFEVHELDKKYESDTDQEEVVRVFPQICSKLTAHVYLRYK